MAQFYGVITRSKRKVQPTATSTKSIGMAAICASWEGAIRVELYHADGADRYRVHRISWPEGKTLAILAEGRLDGQAA